MLKNYYDLKEIEKNNYYKNNIILKEMKKDYYKLKINYKLMKYYENIINENRNKENFKYLKYFHKIRNDNNIYELIKIIFKYDIDNINNISYYNIRNTILNYKCLLFNYENVLNLMNEKINYIENL